MTMLPLDAVMISEKLQDAITSLVGSNDIRAWQEVCHAHESDFLQSDSYTLHLLKMAILKPDRIFMDCACAMVQRTKGQREDFPSFLNTAYTRLSMLYKDPDMDVQERYSACARVGAFFERLNR